MSILLQRVDKEQKIVVNPKASPKLNEKKTILKELKDPSNDNFVILGKKEKKKTTNRENTMLSYFSRETNETKMPTVKSSSKQKIVLFDDSHTSKSEFMDLNSTLPQEKTPKLQTEKELKTSLAPFLKVKDKKKNLLSQIMSGENKIGFAEPKGEKLDITFVYHKNSDTIYCDNKGFKYLQTTWTRESKSLKCMLSSQGCSAKAMMYEKYQGNLFLNEEHNHESDFS